MKRNTVVIDASCLIHFREGQVNAENFKQLLNDTWDAWCTEVAVIETLYILCREFGWDKALEKITGLRESNVIRIESIDAYSEAAGHLKCERSISLPDCFTIALAEYLKCPAVFARREKELDVVIQKNPFTIEIIFLDEFFSAEDNNL